MKTSLTPFLRGLIHTPTERKAAKEAAAHAAEERALAAAEAKKAQAEKRKQVQGAPRPDKNDKAAVEKYFMAELERGDEALQKGVWATHSL